MNETYKINTVADFMKVPCSRRDACLKDFRVFIDAHEATTNMLGPTVTMNAASVTFLWKDDDIVGIASIQFTCGEEVLAEIKL